MKTYSNRSGFTLIEVIAVLVIIGIITALAVTSFSSNPNNLIAAKDTLTSHLRLAQARAMSTSADNVTKFSVWGVRFISTTQYHLFYCADTSACDPTIAANQTAFLGAGSTIIDLAPKGVQVTNGALILAFDRFGTPFTDAALTTSLATQLTLTLQDNKGNTRTINITPQTGMITS
jgi:prepilin-type N-terminal cleavage/methylation domain-containing protein